MKSLYFSSWSSSLPLVLFCFFFIMPGFPVLQSNPQLFENCRKAEFKCGNNSIGYPFFGGGRLEGCGHRELQLHCDDVTNSTMIDIHHVKYRVLGIQKDRQILRISESDESAINEGLCRLPFQDPDSILDFQVVTPGPNFTKVTLFFDCPSFPTIPPSSLRSSPCDNEYSNVTVAIANNTHPKGCPANLTVSIPQTSWERVCNPSLGLEQAFPTEFEVRWKVDKQACLNCRGSGGGCGVNQDDHIWCYCPSGNWPDKSNKCQNLTSSVKVSGK